MVDCLQSLQSLKLCFLWFTLESIHRWSSWFISINVDVVLEMHQSVNSSKQYRVHCYINYMHLWSSFGLNDDFEGLKSFRLLHASRELMSQHPSLFPRLAYSDSLFLSPGLFTICTDTSMTTIWLHPRQPADDHPGSSVLRKLRKHWYVGLGLHEEFSDPFEMMALLVCVIGGWSY